MLFLATTGRCGTMAISQGLSEYSDTKIEHETTPILLREAYLKHIGKDYKTEKCMQRLRYFEKKSKAKYGHAFRAVPLLEDIAERFPDAKFTLIFRDPLQYIRSASATSHKFCPR